MREKAKAPCRYLARPSLRPRFLQIYHGGRGRVMATPGGGGNGDRRRDVYRIIQVLTPPSVFWPRRTAAAALMTRAPPFSGDDRCSGAAGSFTCGGAGGRIRRLMKEAHLPKTCCGPLGFRVTTPLPGMFLFIYFFRDRRKVERKQSSRLLNVRIGTAD